DGAVRREGVGEDDPDLTLLDGEGLPIAQAGLEPRLRQRAEAQSPGEEIGRGKGVADVKLYVIDSAQHVDLPVDYGFRISLPAAGRAAWRSTMAATARAPSPRTTEWCDPGAHSTVRFPVTKRGQPNASSRERPATDSVPRTRTTSPSYGLGW